jgi:hypothetical protein
MKTTTYDYCIIGGGCTGFYAAYKILKRYPKAKLLLLEASDRFGGRINTVKFKDKDGTKIQYEAGGARFSNKHNSLVKLLKVLDIYNTKIPIPSSIKFEVPDNERPKYQQYITEFKTFDNIIDRINIEIKTRGINNQELRSTTLIELCKNYLDSLYPTEKYNIKFSKFIEHYFTYWCEFAIMNAYDALYIFTKEFKSNVQYYILKDGYSAIIDKLNVKCNSLGNFNTKLNSRVSNVSHSMDTNLFNISIGKYNLNNTENTYASKHIIFAIPVNKLKDIKLHCNNKIKNTILQQKQSRFKKLITTHLSEQPLYRIYARYPNWHYKLKNKKDCDCKDNTKVKEKVNTVWFKDMGKLAIPSGVKYIIPVDTKSGIIMIAYTDGKYAKSMINNIRRNKHYLSNMLNKAIGNFNIEIPTAKWIKHYYWNDGASYWKPSVEDKSSMGISASIYSKYISNEIATLYNNVFSHNRIYCLGENISTHQVWVEGCLQSVDDYLSLKKNDRTKRTKKHSNITSKYLSKKNVIIH